LWPPRQWSIPDPAGCPASAASHRSWSSSPRARHAPRRSRCGEGDKSLHHVFLSSNLGLFHERNVRDAEIRRCVTSLFGLNAVPRDTHELAEENLVRAVEIESAEPEARPAHDLVLRAGAIPRQLAEDREEQHVTDSRLQLVADVRRAEHVSRDRVVVSEIHVLIP